MTNTRAPQLPRPRGKRLPMGLTLRAYLIAARILAPFAPMILRKRALKGREDTARIPEKLGVPSGWRPANERLVWMHAVGLGEVLALRGLIAEMVLLAPDLQFLITSSARSSAEVFAANCPPHTQHQFLPLDAPRFYRPFLKYWKPELAIFAEQDLWPGIITETHNHGIPMALVNARMGIKSYTRRARFRGIYKDLLARFTLISAQDPISAANLDRIGTRVPVQTHPSLKLIAPALAADADALRALRGAIGKRRVWMVGPSHITGETLAIAAHREILKTDPTALLLIVPRYPSRSAEIATLVRDQALQTGLRSANTLPQPGDQIFIADSFGEMGLWYRLASAAVIGGTFSDIEGHNPWEAARLGAAILHGPRTENFIGDYDRLCSYRAATLVETPHQIAEAVLSDLGPQSARAAACCAENSAAIRDLAAALVEMIPGGSA